MQVPYHVRTYFVFGDIRRLLEFGNRVLSGTIRIGSIGRQKRLSVQLEKIVLVFRKVRYGAVRVHTYEDDTSTIG